MIPFPVAPLTGIAVLVTRPAEQASSLCARIESLGGTAVAFPTVAIEPIHDASAASWTTCEYEWLVFTSVNAVTHGLQQIKRGSRTRIAAIGNATAAALRAVDVSVEAMPSQGSNSEALLEHPALAQIAEKTILLVKGAGGRELLYEALTARGANVTIADVYRRVRPAADSVAIQQLETRWREGGIDTVTLTSVETLDNLLALLSAEGRTLLESTAFIAASERIAEAARARGLAGPCLPARGADDDSIVGALASWHARAR